MNNKTKMSFVTQYDKIELLLTNIQPLKGNFDTPNIYGWDIVQPLKKRYSSVNLDEAKEDNIN